MNRCQGTVSRSTCETAQPRSRWRDTKYVIGLCVRGHVTTAGRDCVFSVDGDQKAEGSFSAGLISI